MKTNELNENQMEQVTGGGLLDDVKDYLLNLFPNPFEPVIPEKPVSPDFLIGRGKC